MVAVIALLAAIAVSKFFWAHKRSHRFRFAFRSLLLLAPAEQWLLFQVLGPCNPRRFIWHVTNTR